MTSRYARNVALMREVLGGQREIVPTLSDAQLRRLIARGREAITFQMENVGDGPQAAMCREALDYLESERARRRGHPGASQHRGSAPRIDGPL